MPPSSPASLAGSWLQGPPIAQILLYRPPGSYYLYIRLQNLSPPTLHPILPEFSALVSFLQGLLSVHVVVGSCIHLFIQTRVMTSCSVPGSMLEPLIVPLSLQVLNHLKTTCGRQTEAPLIHRFHCWLCWIGKLAGPQPSSFLSLPPQSRLMLPVGQSADTHLPPARESTASRPRSPTGETQDIGHFCIKLGNSYIS